MTAVTAMVFPGTLDFPVPSPLSQKLKSVETQDEAWSDDDDKKPRDEISLKDILGRPDSRTESVARQSSYRVASLLKQIMNGTLKFQAPGSPKRFRHFVELKTAESLILAVAVPCTDIYTYRGGYQECPRYRGDSLCGHPSMDTPVLIRTTKSLSWSCIYTSL